MNNCFYINTKGFGARSISFDSKIFTKNVLNDISMKISGNINYDVKWIKNKNIGRYIQFYDFKTKNMYYISFSRTKNESIGRDSTFQSIATGFRLYLLDKMNKNKHFLFYIMPSNVKKLKTSYHLFFYRVLLTIGIKILNLNIINNQLTGFYTVLDLINERNRVSGKNQGNKSSYIEEADDGLNIYGKTFGANSKQTTLLCLALEKLTNKNIILFQVLDNNNSKINKTDLETLQMYSKENKKITPTIMEDTYEIKTSYKSEKLRDKRFNYNILEKNHMEKKCILCDCKIGKIVEGAHIYPVSDIDNNKKLNQTQKIKFAVDGNNGIWLCKNHHKLFDSDFIVFINGNLKIKSDLSSNDIKFINEITKSRVIPKSLYNNEMKKYFSLRYKKLKISNYA